MGMAPHISVALSRGEAVCRPFLEDSYAEGTTYAVDAVHPDRPLCREHPQAGMRLPTGSCAEGVCLKTKEAGTFSAASFFAKGWGNRFTHDLPQLKLGAPASVV